MPDDEELSFISEEDSDSTDEDPFAYSFLESYRVRDALFTAILQITLPRSGSPKGQFSRETTKDRHIPTPEEIQQLKNEWEKFRPDIDELGSYLGLDLRSEKHLAELLDRCHSLGLNSRQGLDLARVYTKKKRGAGISVRQIAVQALELRIAEPQKWKWIDLTQKFCPCGKRRNEHSSFCREKIRQSVIALEKVLRRHNVYPT